MKYFRDGLEIQTKDPPRVVVREGHTCEVFETPDGSLWFITLEGTPFCAHGNSFRDAVAGAKEKQKPGAGKEEALARVKRSGRVTLTDFCLVTGACRAGASVWARQQSLTLTKSSTVKKTLELLDKSDSSSWGDRLRKELEET